MRHFMLLVMVLGVVGLAIGQQPERRTVQPPKIELGEKEVRLPMAFFGGRPIIEAKVNGKGPYRFYFDTGASGPVLSEKLATELKLEVVGQAGVKSGGDGPDKKPIQVNLVRVDRIDLGEAKLSGVTIAAMDRVRLGDENAPVGVLSPAMFPGYLVVLDYPKKEIRIRSGELGEPDGKTVFGYQQGRPIPSVMATIGDQMIETHLDSGSGGGLSLPTKIAEKLPLDGKPVETGKKARSVSGEFPVFEGKLKGELKFGQFTFENPTIDFSDVVQRGNIGARILQRFVITLDVKNRRFQMIESK